jgi:hypothetical protein
MKAGWSCAGRLVAGVAAALVITAVVPAASARVPRLVLNPYEGVDWGRVNQYRANLHAHTVESGGELFLDDLFQAYARLGYSILAVTDHNHCTHWQKAGLDPLKQHGVLPVMGQE